MCIQHCFCFLTSHQKSLFSDLLYPSLPTERVWELTWALNCCLLSKLKYILFIPPLCWECLPSPHSGERNPAQDTLSPGNLPSHLHGHYCPHCELAYILSTWKTRRWRHSVSPMDYQFPGHSTSCAHRAWHSSHQWLVIRRLQMLTAACHCDIGFLIVI